MAMLILSACQGTSGLTRPRTSTSVGGHGSPQIAASAKPSASPVSSPTPSPTPTQAAASSPPSAPPVQTGTSVPMALLTGLIKINADYVIAAGAGNVIAAGSGNVIAAGAGNVIAAGSGNVIAAGGGNVIAAGGGNVIPAGAGNYRLIDFSLMPESTSSATASGTAEPFPAGEMMPVKGMVVVPVSLTDGKLLGPAAVTDDTGTYHVNVPQSDDNNIRLLAAMPGKNASDPVVTDPRLRYELLTSQSDIGQHNEIDEDTSVVTSYVRTSLTARLKDIMFNATDPVPSLLSDWGLGDGNPAAAVLSAQLQTGLETLRKQAQTAYPDHQNTDAGVQSRLSQRVMDILLANVSLYEVSLNPVVASRYTHASTDNAINVLTTALKQIRGAVDADLQARSDYFDTDAGHAVLTGNGAFQPNSMPQILKDSDFGDYMVKQVLAPDDTNSFTYLSAMLEALGANGGITLQGVSSPVDASDSIEGACTSIVFAIVGNMSQATLTTATDTIANFKTIDADPNQVTE